MQTVKLLKNLKPESITAIIDTREQNPLTLDPLKTVRKTLTTGDYSVVGLENVIAVERKSLQDLIMCVGRERERFDREVQRLMAYPVRALFVEGNWMQIEMKQYRGTVNPNAVLGSLIGWVAAGLPVFMVDNHMQAGVFVSRFLYIAARRRYLETYDLLDYMVKDVDQTPSVV